MGIVVLLVYVDDIVITGSDSTLLAQLKTHLSKSFHMKDLGPLTYFLGLEVHRSPSRISLNQHKSASDLMATAGLQEATSVASPMELNVKLRKEKDDLLVDPSLYRKLVGSLVYFTIIDQIFLLLYSKSSNFFRLLVIFIWLLSIGSYATFRALLPMAYSFLKAILLVLLLIVMLIGLVVLIHVIPSLVGACS